MRVSEEHVHEERLAVLQMADNSDVAHHAGVIHQRHHIAVTGFA